MKAVEIKALPHYKLFLSFDDGINGIIDLSDFVKNGVFKVLEDADVFSEVYLTAYSIAWSEELEIDIFSVYAELANKTPTEIILSNSQYAAD